jgi:hypothetical protein
MRGVFPMDKLLIDVNNLIVFVIDFLLIYLPCMIGALFGRRFNQLKEKKLTKSTNKKKYTIRHTIGMALTSSIVPALIILIAEYLMPGDREMSYTFKYGLAMLLGFVGADRITEYLMNLSNLLKVMKAISDGAPGLSKISDMIEKTDESDEENKDEQK